MEDFNNFNALQNINDDYFETEIERKLVYISHDVNQNFKDLVNIVQSQYDR
jgi:hypothetical protein